MSLRFIIFKKIFIFLLVFTNFSSVHSASKKIEIKIKNKSCISKINYKKLSKLNLTQLLIVIKTNLNKNKCYLAQPQFVKETRSKKIFDIKNPIKYKVVIEGSSLLDIFSIRSLKKKALSHHAPLTALRINLISLYQKKGFSKISINETITQTSKFEKKIVFSIKKSNQIFIRDITFEGELTKPSYYYKNIFLKLAEKTISKKKYNKRLLEKSIESFSNYMKNIGFLDSKVLNYNILLKKFGRQVHVFIRFSEGSRYMIKEITFKKKTNFFSEKKLIKASGLQINTPLNLEKIDISDVNNKIQSYYHKKGFLRAFVKPAKLEFHEEPKVSVSFSVYEGTKHKFHKFITKGLKKTKADLSLFLIPPKKGVITSDYLQSIKAKLFQTNSFENIKIKTQKFKEDLYNVIIYFEERDRYEYRVASGVSNEYELTGLLNLELEVLNIEGDLKNFYALSHFKYHALLNKSSNFVRLKYNWNNFSVPLGINADFRSFLFDIDVSNKYYSSSNDVSLSFYFYKNLSTNLYMRWSPINLFRSQEELQNNDHIISKTFTHQTLETIFDKRNSLYNPTSGYRVQFQLDHIFPTVTKNNYIKSTASLVYHMPVYSYRWSQLFQTGYLKNLSDTTKVPYSHLFFLGGHESLRGFDSSRSNDRFPNIIDLPYTSDNYGNFLEDKTHYFLVKNQIDIQISQSLFWSVFYDVATLSVDKYKFRSGTRQSMGVGFKYLTPVGPLSLDLAQKNNPFQEEREIAIHFFIGSI